HPRSLPLFPTRRSSDLDSIAVLWNEMDRVDWLRDLVMMVHDHIRFRDEMKRRGKLVRTAGGNPDWYEVRRSRGRSDMSRMYFTRDRKSTRLNSSHVKIS